jgi:uncharacterized membrane protein YbhN (UPF0104 family)
MRWGLRLLGPAILVGMLMTADLAHIGDNLARMDIRFFIAAVLGWFCIAAIKTWRWRHILAAQGISLRYRRALLWYLAGLFLGGVSPGRLGELVKVTLVRELGQPMGRALFSSVLDRLFDLLVLPVVAVAGMGLYGAVFSEELEWVVLALIFTAIGLVLAWRGRHLIALPVRTMIPEGMRQQAGLTVQEFMADFERLGVRDYLLHGGITALCWIGYMGTFDLLAMGMDLAIDPVYLGVAALTAALLGLLPITVSGLGTRDAVLAAFFLRVGLNVSDAIAMSSLILGVNLAIIALYFPAYQVAMGWLETQKTIPK